MEYLSFFILSILERPKFFIILVLLIVSIQITISFLIIKVGERFFKKISAKGDIVLSSLLLTIILAFPGSWFLTGMMCFTTTEVSFVRVIFILWYVLLGVPSFFALFLILMNRRKTLLS